MSRCGHDAVGAVGVAAAVHALLPVGWNVAEAAVNDGRSQIILDHDRAGAARWSCG